MTLGTRTRLREAIRQVADEKLRQYIEACIAIHGNRTSSATAQRRELKAAAEQIAQEAGTPAPPMEYLVKTDTELREGVLRHMNSDTRAGWSSLVQLEQLEVTNFGSFHAHHSVELAPRGPKNVTAFVGDNGLGKSTLFNAINWALYGGEFLQELASNSGKAVEDLVNHKVNRSGFGREFVFTRPALAGPAVDGKPSRMLPGFGTRVPNAGARG